MVGYYLDESNNWRVTVEELRRALTEASARRFTPIPTKPKPQLKLKLSAPQQKAKADTVEADDGSDAPSPPPDDVGESSSSGEDVSD